MSSWLDNSNNSNCLISTQIEGFLDVSGGSIRTRNKDVDTIIVTGDVSLNNATIFAAALPDTSVVVSKDNSSNFIDLVDNATLTPFGLDLSGSYPQSQSGHSMSKNYDGSIIALGASENSAGAGINRGIVRVYQKSDLSWVQLGGDLSGVLDNQHFGDSVGLNGDGTILAVGTKDISNNAFVYKYDGTTWNQRGDTIRVTRTGEDLSFNEHFIIPATKVKLNKEGNKLVTSNRYHLKNTFTGQVQTGTYTAPYSTIGAVNNFEFRQAGVTGSITDDVGGQTATLAGALDATNGAIISSGQQLYLNWLTMQNPVSIELYFKIDGGDNGKALFHLHDQIMFTVYNNTFEFGVRHTTGGLYMYSNTSNPFSNGTWYHLVVTMYHNGSTAYEQFEIQVYINGSHYGTQMKNLHPNDVPTNTRTANLGRSRYTTQKMAGGYRYARFYHKKLSSSEVSQLYSARDTSTLHGTAIYGTGTVVKDHNDGIVQCYEYSDTSWNQVGNTIESSSLNDLSGGDIGINEEGNMITIGYPQTNSATGTTKVFKYDTNDSSWNQIGSNIDGSTTGDHAGTSVVMDGSGDFVTVGAPSANSSAGKVSVYQNINDSWTKKGNDMEGASSNDEFGSAISMNASGDIMVVGAPNAESAKGKAYVHEYNVTDNSWNLKTSVTGTTANDKLGSSVRLNGLGTEVSVGEPGLTVSTPSYDWNFRQNSSSPIYDNISNYPATFSGITANTTDGVRTSSYIAMSPSTQGPSFSIEFYYHCHTGRDTWEGPTTYNFQLAFYSDTVNYDSFSWTQRGKNDAKNIFYVTNYANSSYNQSFYTINDYVMHPNIGTYHDVITMDGTTLYVYRNGTLRYTGTDYAGTGMAFPTANMIYSTINEVHPSVNFAPGGQASSFGSDNELSVYSYRLWNNHALSASEVSTLYANRDTSNYFSNVAKFRTFQMEHTQNFHNFKYLQVPTGRLSIGIENGTNMLDISGNVFISKDLTVSDDLSLNNGTVFVHGDLSVNNVTITGNLKTSEINYNSDVSFSKRLFVNANDISHNGLSGYTTQTHASDLASDGSFSSDIAFNHSLVVPGNMVIVDGSNKTTYGSYTTYTDPSGEKFFHAGKSASNVFNIVNQSNVGVYMASGQSTFSSTSDKKLKTNIQPLENSLEKINKLNPVTYQWKENKKEDSGFIAQEVEEIMPELVEENETYNGEKQKGIKSSELIPFILESLNKIDKKLDEL